MKEVGGKWRGGGGRVSGGWPQRRSWCASALDVWGLAPSLFSGRGGVMVPSWVQLGMFSHFFSIAAVVPRL